ncbi:hypothetical protein LTR84_005692 [Exophiala bonariae]|uniref:Uncharacterized protein n=1 Tax=Exophiala bonariae TaxID=1690606 RepID=A0AAV9N318_9EURO|nr:hypothetical protein LTR84_005692 [Exophiala bonariae]
MDFLFGSTAAPIFGGAQDALQTVAGMGGTKNVCFVDNSNQSTIKMTLAPSYGSLNNEAMKKMDDNTKVMIGTAVSMLQNFNDHDRTWDNVVSAMKSNSLLQLEGGDGIHRSDQITKSGSGDFKFDGSPDMGFVSEVRPDQHEERRRSLSIDMISHQIETWFKNLIGDSDIINTMNVNIQDLARVAAQSGASVDGVGAVFGKDESHFKNVLDIGALRYPDLTNPYFKVYRIVVNAWSHSSRILFHQEDSNGINGDYHCCNFKPNPERIASLREEVRHQAIQIAEDLFKN